MLLDGIHVPLTTPFYPDGRLNLRKLEHNVDRYTRTPAAGMIALGANGEATTLDDAETREALGIAIGAAGAEKVMWAGVARDGVAATLGLIEHAAGVGYDVALVGLPGVLVGVGRSREAMTWFQAVADRSALPLVLASEAGRPLSLDVIGELAGHARVLGVVDGTGASGRIASIREWTAGVKRTATVTTIFAAVTGRMLAKTAAPAGGGATYIGAESLQGGGTAVAVAAPVSAPALKTRTRETGFQVLGGTASGMLEAFMAGALGAAPRLAACAPQACYEVLAGWKDGDQGLAEEKQERLIAAAARIEEQMGVPGMKYACDLNGYFGGRPRLPYLPVDGAGRAEIEQLMRGMRN
jgi:4-hydroxy-2-oxoglutarate aldolase